MLLPFIQQISHDSCVAGVKSPAVTAGHVVRAGTAFLLMTTENVHIRTRGPAYFGNVFLLFTRCC